MILMFSIISPLSITNGVWPYWRLSIWDTILYIEKGPWHSWQIKKKKWPLLSRNLITIHLYFEVVPVFQGTIPASTLSPPLRVNTWNWRWWWWWWLGWGGGEDDDDDNDYATLISSHPGFEMKSNWKNILRNRKENLWLCWRSTQGCHISEMMMGLYFLWSPMKMPL